MSPRVKGHILRNTALFYHLFQWFADFPIVYYNLFPLQNILVSNAKSGFLIDN